jgi:hypothetical protein
VGRKHKTTRPRPRDVVAEPELHAEPDWDKYAWALLQFVKLQREAAERENQQRKPESAE